ncbi:caspase family protein [Novipirellula sp.]|uniref:caspase family protein n=1 Tax=Novipirellula sp. TaxID=2795430 RepID=UPI00356431D4
MSAKRLHVLIAGVSEYPRLPSETEAMPAEAFGLRKLSSPALSAFRLYRWLQENESSLPAPLGHVSLLLSPSLAEVAADAELAAAQAAGSFRPAALDDFQEAAGLWRDAASDDPDSMTWFYFAGHGIQRSREDAILLLQDFGQKYGGPLQHAVDIHTIFYGMAPSASRPQIARQQMYFIDACRMRPEEFQKIATPNPSEAFQVELSGQDDRRAPIFFATISGAKALGFQSKLSLFCETLLKCLDGAAGLPIDEDDGSLSWKVTSRSLPDAMRTYLDEWNAYGGPDQTFTVGGLMPGDVVLRNLAGPPMVDVLIDINPDLARSLAHISVTEAVNLSMMPLTPPGPPFEVQWPAGIYRLQVEADPPYVNAGPIPRQLLPPRGKLIGKVTP